jgi:long-chain acyl-CoA synthetase
MPSRNASIILDRAADRWPESEYLIGSGQRMTYAQSRSAANSLASGLAGLGIGPGDRVAFQIPNSPMFAVLQFAIWRLGAVPVPLHPAAPSPEITRLLGACQPVALAGLAAQAEALAQALAPVPSCRHLLLAGAEDVEGGLSLEGLMRADGGPAGLAERNPDDLGSLLYTSGTTGVAKGVPLTLSIIWYQTECMADRFWQLEPADVVLMVAPGSHLFGQTLLATAAWVGARLVMLPRFDPIALLQALQDERVTFFAGVPTLAQFLMTAPMVGSFDLSSLRRVMFGGAPMTATEMRAFADRFDVEVITGYGMTEGVPVSYFTADMMADAPSESVGRITEGTEVRIVNEAGDPASPDEVGEIWVRGPQMVRQYFESPEQTAAAFSDDWYRTGDLGQLDQAGHLYLHGRKSDLIKRKGYAVYPVEIETILLTMAGVAEVAVVGVPDEMAGEEIKATIVARPGVELTEEAVIAFARENLAAYKVPHIIEFRQSMPRNYSGKVVRSELVAAAS